MVLEVFCTNACLLFEEVTHIHHNKGCYQMIFVFGSCQQFWLLLLTGRYKFCEPGILANILRTVITNATIGSRYKQLWVDKYINFKALVSNQEKTEHQVCDKYKNYNRKSSARKGTTAHLHCRKDNLILSRKDNPKTVKFNNLV